MGVTEAVEEPPHGNTKPVPNLACTPRENPRKNGHSAPFSRCERTTDRQQIVSDLIPYQNDGKAAPAIPGTVGRA
jgi:hypothetical protein